MYEKLELERITLETERLKFEKERSSDEIRLRCIEYASRNNSSNDGIILDAQKFLDFVKSI